MDELYDAIADNCGQFAVAELSLDRVGIEGNETTIFGTLGGVRRACYALLYSGRRWKGAIWLCPEKWLEISPTSLTSSIAKRST